jgi:hypothetical protein
MADNDLTFYSSENGDDWTLIGGAKEGKVVRHRPNPASGGASRDVDVRDFLFREANTPQGRALQQALDARK